MTSTFHITLLLPIPGMARVFAEEILLRDLETAIDTPDLLATEDERLSEWRATVPLAFEEAEARANSEISESASWPGRVTCRLATYRRLYASHFGSETFLKIPELGGESNVPAILPTGAVLKLGRVASARYRHDQKMWDDFIAWRNSPGLVEAAERLIAPHTAAVDRAQWDAAAKRALLAAPFKKWNATSHLPALLRSQVVDLRMLPDGVHVRPGVTRAFEATMSPNCVDLLYAIGVSAFVTDPGLAFAAQHAREIDELAKSRSLVARLVQVLNCSTATRAA